MRKIRTARKTGWEDCEDCEDNSNRLLKFLNAVALRSCERLLTIPGFILAILTILPSFFLQFTMRARKRIDPGSP